VSTKNKIRVLLADDHGVLRAGLKLLLNTQPDMGVVGEAANAREAWDGVVQTKPDVLVLDLTMPGEGAMGLIERLRTAYPQTRVLVLTVHDDPAYLHAALAAGAVGYVVKTAADVELIGAIRAACQGRLSVNLQLAPRTRQPAGHRAQLRKAGDPGLSKREREVLGLLAAGHTHRETARRLFISPKTVDTYRSRIREKLNLQNRAELFRYAEGLGLLPSARSASPGKRARMG
jgi:two-component system response regulator NreC